MNVCSYHLQEAGATPVQEIAYSLATAIGVLDAVRESGQVDRRPLPRGGRLDQLLRQRRHPLRRGDLQDAGLHRAVGPHRPRALRRHRREGAAVPLRRAGQLASASPRPSPRTTCSASCSRRSASRCRRRPGPARSSCRRGTRRSACPARGTSSGRCASSRCWPTRPTCSSTTTSSTARTWSRPRPPSWSTAAQAELDDVLALGGAFEAIDELKGRLVRSHTERMRRIETGELAGRRRQHASPRPRRSPLGGEESILKVDPGVQQELVDDVARVALRSATPTP